MRNRTYALALLAAIAAFILYLPALRNEFVNWDDGTYVYLNVHLRSLDAAFFRWAFFDFHASNWHPLAWISHAVDYALWGLNPWGHHLTNIVFHAANTALVVLLAVKMLEVARERSGADGGARFLNDRTVLISAGVTGLLFGLHPLHVESVAWVAERKDLLCALFFLLSIMAYMDYARGQGTGDSRNAVPRGSVNKQYLLVLGFFMLALMSKPMAVTLPCVMLILDWYPLNRIRSLTTLGRAGLEKIPFLALSLASSVITIMAQRAGESLVSLEYVPLSVRLPVAVRSLAAYLGKMLLPLNLTPLYPYPKNVSLSSVQYVLAVGAVIGITAACVVLAKRQKAWLSAWGYYVVTLIPVLGIVQVGVQSMADRYTYLPSLGPFLIAGVCTAWIGDRVTARVKSSVPAMMIGIAGALCLFVPLSYLTVQQTAVWNNSAGFWTYVIEQEPDHPVPYNNRGTFFYSIGRYDKAIADFNQLIALKASPDAYNNLAMAFYAIGRIDRAIENFDRAISMDPRYYKAYNNRASAFRKTGRVDDAIADYRRAIALAPSSPQAYYNLGVLYAQDGFFDQAVEYYSRALSVDPGYADAYSNRGIVFSQKGDYVRALDDFNRVLELNHNPAANYVNRGNLYLDTGRKQLALADYQKACALGSDVGCIAVRQLTQTSGPD